jgi:hypothetical protein
MPHTQVANVACFDFGAPAAQAVVLKFHAKRGGKLTLRFENAEGSADVAVTAQVSVDDVPAHFANTSVAANGFALVAESIPQKQYKEYQLFLRQGADNYLRILASGEARCQLQIRGDAILDAMDF